MKGTLALWYEPVVPDATAVQGRAVWPLNGRSKRPAETPRVELELHANLWRDLPSGTNFLDLGLMLRRVEHMSRFYLYVPATLTAAHFQDLGPILRSGVTPNAVFNDVVTLGQERDTSYSVSRGSDAFIVHKLRDTDWQLEALNDPLFGDGTRIVFNEALCTRMATQKGPHYLRFRLRLVDAAAATFSSDLIARDRAFASSAGRLELTEFRLNERRSYPASFAERAASGPFKITTIHYFLIRDLEHQLVVQSAPFEKVRRLEAELWRDYVADAYGPENERSTRDLTERMVIYHWKARPKQNEEEIRDFVAFASFRTTTTSLLFYAFVITLLGAAGSALASLLGLLGERWWGSSLTSWVSILIVLGLVLAFLAYQPVITTTGRRLLRWARAE